VTIKDPEVHPGYFPYVKTLLHFGEPNGLFNYANYAVTGEKFEYFLKTPAYNCMGECFTTVNNTEAPFSITRAE